jgi:allantoinase
MPYEHERPFASLHDRLPYVPIVDRPPISWPGGARVAVWVVPNVEHYEYLPPLGRSDPYPRTPHPDVRKHSYHDYGHRVGIWRLLPVFDRYAIPCTASLNVAVLDHYPEVASAMAERKWDLMSHGMYNTRFLEGMSYGQERDFLEACNAVLERHTGQRFRGMLGPFISGNEHTPDVMAEVGMTYHADWVHDERPSPLLNRRAQRLVALPYSYELNDAPILMRSSAEGPEYLSRCIAQLDALYEDASSSGRIMCLPLHPFATGQPHRIRYLEQLFEHLRSHDGVWIATASEIVDHYLAHNYAADLVQAGSYR